MADIDLLRERMVSSGMTVTSIAKRAGMLRETLYNRLDPNADFKASEIAALTRVLKLSKSDRDRIFFPHKGELNSQKENL
ncbi:MAG: XRE family transcriptional regulator [Lacrimispora sp.]|uniref:hypothetical protein n=1 Tax=Lacrimispora sp. TaxID=2719234 RepID=UPI0039E6B5E4